MRTMNYRHAFHAGSFADCMKHALLVWLIDALQAKPAPIFVLDTHAGAGRYDLDAGPAQRTGEWRQGIGRLLDTPPPALARYLGFIRTLGLYPGSPALIRAMLRPDDRLACCELQPDDLFQLRRLFARDPQVAMHQRDGWEALGALLPPKERRGLVLIDPPYENPDEFSDVVAGLATAQRRFRTGVLAAWYPIKHRAPGARFLHRAPADRHPRHRRRRISPPRAGAAGPAERLRPAGGQSAVPLRTRSPADPPGLAGAGRPQRARRLPRR